MKEDARTVALACVLAVTRDDAYANLVMPSLVRDAGLDGRDAGFATELAYGALRMRGLYDAIIASAARRDPAGLDDVVRAVLWIGTHQALALRVPAHAAVSETVDLAKRKGAAKASGLVNAVMRRVTERDLDAWLARVAPGTSREALALRTSHPEWIAGALAQSLAHRQRAAELPALLDSHNVAARVSLAARPGLVDRDALVRESGGTPHPLSPFGVELAGGSPGSFEAVAGGAAGVQDAGSQIVAAAVAADAAREATAGERWWDACAGPGGKAALLGALAASRGAHLDATELHPHRARLVSQSVRAVPAQAVTVATADARSWDGGPYDRIVLDAPCTGLGALRRRPESRWRRTREDLRDLVALQSELLDAAGARLAPGGVLAYITCSPVLDETIEVVSRSGLTLRDARAAVAEVTGTPLTDWGAGPDVQLWTHVHGTDSMYLALLTRDDH